MKWALGKAHSHMCKKIYIIEIEYFALITSKALDGEAPFKELIVPGYPH